MRSAAGGPRPSSVRAWELKRVRRHELGRELVRLRARADRVGPLGARRRRRRALAEVGVPPSSSASARARGADVRTWSCRRTARRAAPPRGGRRSSRLRGSAPSSAAAGPRRGQNSSPCALVESPIRCRSGDFRPGRQFCNCRSERFRRPRAGSGSTSSKPGGRGTLPVDDDTGGETRRRRHPGRRPPEQDEPGGARRGTCGL